MTNKKNSRSASTRKPIEFLIRILAQGGRITHKGRTYAMADDGSLCVVASGDTGIRIDCDVQALFKLAEDIGRDELWLNCCAMQLGYL